jgi:CHAT domain-containing protein/tetratricopeptide (TPR) repeat protein
MVLRTDYHSIIWKLLSGGACLLLVVACLSWIPLCGAETEARAQPAHMRVDNNEIAVDRLADGQLEPGKLVERRLVGGEIHSYRIMLTAGQFLNVVINQQGINVVMTLFGPDGKLIIEIDISDSDHRPEPLHVVADVDGSYRLEVRARDKQSRAGKYVVKTEQLRVATPQDRKWFVADLTLAAASQLNMKGTAQGARDALEKYKEALSLMRDAGNRKGEAYTLDRIGSTYKSQGDNQKAIEYYHQALTIFRDMGARWEEASVLNGAAIVYHILGDRQKALEYFNLALPIVRTVGDQSAETIVLTHIGAVHDSLGEKQEALEYFNLALQLIRATRGHRGQEAIALNNIGTVHDSLGDKQRALEYYNLALPLLSQGSRFASVVLTNIGAVYKSLGDYQKALGYYDKALPRIQSLGDRRGEALTLNQIGLVYGLSGNNQKALEYFNLALSLIKAVGDRYREAVILTNIGIVYESLGEKQKALDYFGESLQLSRAVKARNTELLTIYHVARTQRSLNNLVEARLNMEAALEIAESLRAKVISQELRASYFASVQQYYDFYIDLLMCLDQLHPDRGYQEIALGASERARARILLEMLTEARADIHQGVEPSLLERERSLRQLLDTKTERQVTLLSGKHTPQEAEQINKEVEQWLAQYQEVQARIKLKSPGYAALTQPSPLTLKEIQQEVLDADTLLLEYALGEEHSYLWAVTHDSMVTFQLPKRAEIEEAAQRVYDLLSLYGQQKGPRQFDSSYVEAVSALSRIVLGPVAAHLGKKRLVIVAQGALSYIPFAALSLPPVQKTANAIKPAQANLEPLITEHEIIHLPSASALAVLRRQFAGRKLPPKAVAVIADPVFNKDDVRVRAAIKGAVRAIGEKRGGREDEPVARPDNVSQIALLRSVMEAGLSDGNELPRLPFSRQEALAISALGRQAGAMSALDFNASRETATGTEIGQYRTVHFATHALLNNEHPELSGLVLSRVTEHGEAKNGFLRLYDIYNLRLGADLVVLSACQTALGKQIKGEGLIGVTRGFMYAGAARVIASLWKVQDEATAELMKKFYTGMMKEGQKPAAALRAAQLWMQKQKRWQSPYYWAGFILQGEWR